MEGECTVGNDGVMKWGEWEAPVRSSVTVFANEMLWVEGPHDHMRQLKRTHFLGLDSQSHSTLS